ncbi:amidohydrolase family protein [Candidatus Neomarinimicrobiota bacterium]
MRVYLISICLITFGWASDQVPAAKQQQPIVLTGATIYPISGEPIVGGQILFSEGRIVELGQRISSPAGAEIIDVAGKEIYPGFILAESNLGLVEIDAVHSTRDEQEVGDVNPNVIGSRAYNPDSEHIPITRATGIAIANVVPEGGLLSGTSSAMLLDAWTVEDALLKVATGIWLNWPESAVSPGMSAKARDKKIEAYQKRLDQLDDIFDRVVAYGKLNAGASIKQTDFRWTALQPVIERNLPLFIRAEGYDDILAAVNWTQRRGFKMVLVGGTAAALVSDKLVEREIPVIIRSVHNLPVKRWAAYSAPATLAAQLESAGVLFSYVADGDHVERNLPFQAGRAEGFGLSHEAALRSITLAPAQILNIDDRVGSLEVGKDATLIVTDGDPLDLRSQVEMMFIQGREVDLGNRHSTLYEKYRQRYLQSGRIE